MGTPPRKRRATASKVSATSKRRSTTRSKATPAKTFPLSQSFRFLDLPREIRDIIYSLSLRSMKSIRVGEDHPALVKVNKQIRKESLSIFYKYNSISFNIHGLHICPLLSWLDKTGAELTKRIGVLKINFKFHRNSTCPTLSEPTGFLEAWETFLSPNVRIQLKGREDSLAQFHIACEMGRKMRQEGLSWDVIGLLLFRANQMVTVYKEDCYCQETDDYDEYPDGVESPVSKFVQSWTTDCSCSYCKTADTYAARKLP